MKWRRADSKEDLPLLTRLNAALIRDEGHANAMSILDLEARMRSWLDTTYTAVVFEDAEDTIGYALFQPHEYGGVHLRHFFIAPNRRRRGLGARAFQTLREEVFPTNAPVVLDVLTLNCAARAFWEKLGFEDYARILRLGS
jgi:GNAT superfamily N-acetyltransferase